MSFGYIVRESTKFWRYLATDWSVWLLTWVGISLIGMYIAFLQRDFIDSLLSMKLNGLVFLGIGLIALSISLWILNVFGEYVPKRASTKMLTLLALRASDEILKARYQVVESRRGDILARLTNDIAMLSMFYGAFLPSIVVQVVRLGIGALTLVLLSPTLTLFAALLIPLYYTLYRVFSTRLSRASEAERREFSGYVSVIEELLNSYDLLKRAMVMEFARDRTAKSLNRWAESYRRLLFLEVFFNQSYNWLFSLISTLMLVVGGLVVVQQGLTTIGTLIAFTRTVWNLYEPIVNLNAMLIQGSAFIPLIRRYYEVLNIEKEVDGERDISEATELVLRDVRVAIENREILRGVSAIFTRGKIVAIVGRSGVGKTTLAKTLIRLIEPVAGAIMLNGVEYRSIRLKCLRRLVYYVPTKDVVLRGTVRENLALGEDYSDEEMFRALRVADVDFVKSLDDAVAPEKLSDGQRQRLALARAVLRKPAVLILDEALSFVEEWRERKILKNLRSYLRDSLIIVISHRSSVLDLVDEVYALENGVLRRLALEKVHS
ncbi:MAG: hypothetical protein DRO13_05095 [Thermoprotei archaeon]|nr:MAG: hypothetical protein DRO13_05095 [Thermoprotei archaeon]